MQLDRIILRDVGPFKDVTIELPPGKDPQLADVYLLTGPNGSGKSTVLYALGAILAGVQDELGSDFLSRRFRTDQSLAGFAAGDIHCVATVPRSEAAIPDPTRWSAPGRTCSSRARHATKPSSTPGTSCS